METPEEFVAHYHKLGIETNDEVLPLGGYVYVFEGDITTSIGDWSYTIEETEKHLAEITEVLAYMKELERLLKK